MDFKKEGVSKPFDIEKAGHQTPKTYPKNGKDQKGK